MERFSLAHFCLRLRQLRILAIFYLVKIGSLFAPKKHHWILCERGTDARDNGYAFYHWLKQNHPEQPLYYLIDFHSADYPKVQADAVRYGSLKSIYLVATAEKIISTHIGTMLPDFSAKMVTQTGLNKKFYWLQHGVIKEYMPVVDRCNNRPKITVCSSLQEYDFIHQAMHQPTDTLALTAMPRYDTLYSTKTPQKQVLIMPTWRHNLGSRATFRQSAYLKHFNHLLNNPRLAKLLREYGYKAVFYPHYEVQKHLDLFHCQSPDIRLAGLKDTDVQTLLKESAVLITDYSSVYFDFFWLRKPVIFDQFDHKTYFKDHDRAQGWFNVADYATPCHDETTLLDALEATLKHRCRLDPKYAKKIENVFPFRDRRNCTRVYQIITGKKTCAQLHAEALERAKKRSGEGD